MMTFGDRIVARCRAVGSSICLGLDPRADLLPPDVLEAARDTTIDPDDVTSVTAEAFSLFCRRLLDTVGTRVAVVKLQMAFFEALRTEGFRAFEAVCVHARSLGIPVIIDGKRGDIGTTAAAYARAYLEATEKGPPLGDALTVNAWLGSDGVFPFLDAARPHGGGIFVLVKTSNPSSCEVQDLECEGTPLYEHMATLVRSWNTPIGASGYGPVGAVVGATWPDHLVWLRGLLPGSILLLPGYGTQGAGPEDVVGGFDDEGVGALVSASRSLTFPWATDGAAPRDWEGRVLTVVNEMRRDLARVLGGSG